MHHRGTGSLNPRVLDSEHAVTHARDQVDEEFSFMRLGEPNRIADLALESALAQVWQNIQDGACGHEHIQILGETADSRMLAQSECS